MELNLQIFTIIHYLGQLSAVNVTEKDVVRIPVNFGKFHAIGERLFHAGSEHLLEIRHSGGQNHLVRLNLSIWEDESDVGVGFRDEEPDEI